MLPKIKSFLPGDLGIDVVIPQKREHINPILRALNSELELKLDQDIGFHFND